MYSSKHHGHVAVQHNLHSYLYFVKAKALHNKAVLYEDEVQALDLELLQEEKTVKEYQDLLDQAEQAIQECQQHVQEDSEASHEARVQAQEFLDSMYTIEHEFAQTCARYHVTDAMCDTVARFNGVDAKETSLALDALSKEQVAYAAETRQEADEQLELSLEKNATHIQAMEQQAEFNATLLRNEYKEDEEREEDMEGNATALFRQAHVERQRAIEENALEQQDRLESTRLFHAAKLHQKRARWCTLFALVASVTLLYTFASYLWLLIVLNHQRASSKVQQHVLDNHHDDASTAYASVASEDSPLMNQQQHDASSFVEIGSMDAADSYSTIDLRSGGGGPSVSSSLLSPSSYGSGWSEIEQNARALVQRATPTIQRWWPKVELVLVVLVVAFAAQLLLFQILPNLHNL